MEKKNTYLVLSPLMHDGLVYAPHAKGMNKVEFTEKQAAPLLLLKVIGEPVTGVATEEDKSPDAAGSRVAEILAALNKGVVKTITDKAEDFNNSGRKALVKELGWVPENVDVDAALTQLKSDQSN